MSKSKKTINVNEVLDHANALLALSECPTVTKDFKEGVCAMLHHILHKSNNYHGFMFLNNDDSELGTFGNVTRKYFK
jgi:hypothetical protein